ncbi:aldo/keto reductase [Streptomyces cheonanensis]|uniref:Aldo/keto reductase n=2 Tax=Streptomyces TaxID=1883 RepID=A0ABP5GMI1_9ACTN
MPAPRGARLYGQGMTATIALNDGTSIPQLGFGTYLVPPQDTQAIVGTALEVGYRHIDTAQMYGNEAEVGRAVAESGLSRGELYLTSKLDNGNHRPDDVRRTFAESLARLGVDRLDLFLIHWPLPTLYDGDYVSTWQAVAGLIEEGTLRSAGVSNFEPEHLDRIIGETGVVPAVNQIEVHPYFPNERARAASLSHGIAVEAWGPLGQGAVLGDEVIAGIAERTGRPPAQVILRWHIQRGDIVFPKSSSRARMEENSRIFDFDLSPQDMAAIDGLDQGPQGRGGPDPNTFAYLP